MRRAAGAAAGQLRGQYVSLSGRRGLCRYSFAKKQLHYRVYSRHGWEYQHDKGFFEKNNLASENNISGWGVHDDTLINHVFSEFERLSASQHNFLLSFLTVNTHPPAGTYLSTCDNHIPSDISNPMLKSAACSDYLLGQFIDKIIHSEYFDNTVIVLVSDHLMMANAASADLEKVQDQRRNNFIVIKKGIEPKKVDKAGTLLDVWPTLLTVSGATDTDFGFGHSLLGNAQSSILEAWREHANISDYLGFASHLWNYPSLNDPMSYKNDVLTIGQQQYNIPAFGIADKNKNIKGLYFEAFALNARRLTQEGDTLFYINRCEMTSGRSQGLCGYELTKDTTVQYEITEQGVANRRVVETTSPLYTQDLVAISSGPLNVQTGITDGKDEQLIPRGVTFYRLNGNQLSGGKVIDFDTCENKAVDTNTVKHLLGDGSTPLIFTSNDSAFCIPYETRPSINTVLRSDAATQLAPRQQVVGVYGDKETKFIIGKADKPLDVFINRDNFKLYPLCDIFSDCQ